MPVRECECECNLLALQNLVTKGEEQGESPQSRRERAQGEGTRPCFCALPLLSSDFCQRVLVFFLFVTPSCPPPLPGPEGKEARGSGEEQGGKQGEEGLGFSRFSSPLVGRLFLFFFLFSLDGETKGHEEEDERGEREQRAPPPPKGKALGLLPASSHWLVFFLVAVFIFPLAHCRRTKGLHHEGGAVVREEQGEGLALRLRLVPLVGGFFVSSCFCSFSLPFPFLFCWCLGTSEDKHKARGCFANKRRPLRQQ